MAARPRDDPQSTTKHHDWHYNDQGERNGCEADEDGSNECGETAPYQQECRGAKNDDIQEPISVHWPPPCAQFSLLDYFFRRKHPQKLPVNCVCNKHARRVSAPLCLGMQMRVSIIKKGSTSNNYRGQIIARRKRETDDKLQELPSRW